LAIIFDAKPRSINLLLISPALTLVSLSKWMADSTQQNQYCHAIGSGMPI